MKAYETLATVEREGQLRLAGVPFEAGTEVEVTVNAKRRSSDEFASQWKRVIDVMRLRSGHMGDDEIQTEFNEYRAGS
jgi:hypothetical protein